jgi:hypothetical protein
LINSLAIFSISDDFLEKRFFKSMTGISKLELLLKTEPLSFKVNYQLHLTQEKFDYQDF